MREAVTFKIVWSNEHASGELPITYSTYEEATEAAHEWKADMVAMDDNPEDAAREYDWDVIQVPLGGKSATNTLEKP